jgi:hypothetical protein
MKYEDIVPVIALNKAHNWIQKQIKRNCSQKFQSILLDVKQMICRGEKSPKKIEKNNCTYKNVKCHKCKISNSSLEND